MRLLLVLVLFCTLASALPNCEIGSPDCIMKSTNTIFDGFKEWRQDHRKHHHKHEWKHHGKHSHGREDEDKDEDDKKNRVNSEIMGIKKNQTEGTEVKGKDDNVVQMLLGNQLTGGNNTDVDRGNATSNDADMGI